MVNYDLVSVDYGEKPIGIVLSNATTSSVRLQLTEYGELNVIEGKLIIIKSRARPYSYLGRVESMIPVNEFYREDDPFVVVRRKGVELEFVKEIGRRYVIADVVLLGLISCKGLSDVRVPPEPGDRAYLFDINRDGEKVFGVKPGSPGIIWYGSLIGYDNASVPLDVEAITMHMGIFGITGSGKSYNAGILMEKFASIPYEEDGNYMEIAIPIIVIDANGDYVDYHRHFIEYGRLGAFRDVRRYVFPHSSARYGFGVREITISLNELSPREIAEFIIAYKSGGELNELQVAGLERAISEVLNEGYIGSINKLLTTDLDIIKDKLLELSKDKTGGVHFQTARAIMTALEKFHMDLVEKINIISDKPELSSELIDWLVENPSLLIIDFSPEGAPGVSLPLKQLIIGYLVRILYNKFTSYKIEGKERYLVLMIEEAQNYIPNKRIYPVGWSLARDYLSLIATQGRKFGLSLCLISQRPMFIDPVVLSMINTFFIHRISPEDITYVMKLSGGLPKALERKLPVLPRGVVILSGQMNKLGFPVLLHVGKRTVEHRMGTTHVLSTLANVYKK